MVSAWPLYLLILLLPFEPPTAVFHALGLEFTLLEVAAGIALAWVTVDLGRTGRLRDIARAPLLLPALAFLAACLLSTAFAQAPQWLPLKFTLRVATGVTAFALASAALRDEARITRLLDALAIAGVAVALLGLGEACGLPGADRFVASFREQDFEVGGTHRVAAGFAYPNLAGGFLVLALPAALVRLARAQWAAPVALRAQDVQKRGKFGWARKATSTVYSRESTARTRMASRALDYRLSTVDARLRPSRPCRFGGGASLVGALLMFAAILLTYSRGALAGALVAPLALAAWGRRQQVPEATRQAKWALAGFLALGAALALASPSFRLRAMSEGDASWYRADFLSEVSPGEAVRLAPGELGRIPLRVKNIGGNTWKIKGTKRFHLSYHWYDLGTRRVLELEGERTALPGDVQPGETTRLVANVRAPRVSGRFLLVWDMVQEHTTWFVGKAGAGHFMPVTVGDPPEGATAKVSAQEVARSFLADTWFPGRLELWSIATRLFLQNPVLGVGPDNFRWLYGPAAGRRRWDTRVFSNSLYLETLATTGLLGGAAFFVLLASALAGLLALARQNGSEQSERALLATTLLATLIGFLAHGVFDYLLEPTSLYLAFWLLLGASSALWVVARDAEGARRRVPHHACWV